MRTTANVWVLSVLFLNGIFTLANSILTDDVRTQIVNLHNVLRRNFARGANGAIVANMGKLEWNTSLESVAQETLNYQCNSGTFTNRNAWYSLRSNLKLNSLGNFSSDILSWNNEIETNNFSPTEGACGPYNRCLHAYTLLSAKHRHIGCAYNPDCRHNTGALLCVYDGSTFPFYKSGPICTKCPVETPFCDNGLCVACDTTLQECDCKKTCRNPPVGLGELDRTTCSCKCQYGMGLNCDEPCSNPVLFYDYDMCSGIPSTMCSMPDYVDMMNEFCPEKCSCRSFPGES